MSQLTEQLNELEKQGRALAKLDAWAITGALPKIGALLALAFNLVAALVHQVERQQIIIDELKRRTDG